jgi:peptidase M23-like protein
MGAPNLSVAVEPTVNGSVVFMALAPNKKGAQPAALLCLRLMVTNNGSSPVHLNGVGLSFSPPVVGPFTDPTGIDIPPGWTMEWNFSTAEDVILPASPPQSLTLNLNCGGFSSPAVTTLPLAQYTMPSGGYLFPTDWKALKPGEFWQAASGTHGEGNWGSQLFAYDLGVIAIDPMTQQWSPFLPGMTGVNNSDLRIWGKPVCAVADGTVLERIDGVPNNPHPLHWTSDADLAAQLAQQQALYWGGFTNGGAGNHFYIQHGENVVLYAHMQNGSLNTKALPGMTVKAGDVLGLAGNAGNSTGPHLHVHAIKGTAPEDGPLRPMPFRNTLSIDLTALTSPFPDAPWVKLADQGPPHVTSAIWPASQFLKFRPPPYEAAIDPLALILSEDLYVRLTLPDPPPIDIWTRQMAATARALSPAQRGVALERLAMFRETYLAVVQRVLSEAGLSKREKV